MELISIQPPSPSLIDENYETLLKESITRFQSDTQNGISDFSTFTSIFSRFLQARVDPPLETIWFYSAVRFHTIKKDQNDLLRVKELFQLLTACSGTCNGLKSVAVVCPVLFELYKVVVLSGKGVEKKVKKEIECLIDGVLSYVSICGCDDYGRDDNGLEGLLSCFGDLVRVWTGGNIDVEESLRVFFPLVSDEIRDGFGKGEFGVGYLVGVVIVQGFLLRLCFKIRDGGGLSKVGLQKELTTWAVGSFTAFRNCCFFDILLQLLLDSTLPVTCLLDSKDVGFLRKILYDAVILVEYSFLNIEREMMLTSNCINRLTVRRLIVVHEATQAAREKGDHTKAVSYMNAFSRSCLQSKLVKWATSQIGMDEEACKPNVTTPQALLKWLLNIEDQGVRVFNNDTLKLRAKLVLDESKAGYDHRVTQPNSKMGDELLFYIDKKPEEEKVDDDEMEGEEGKADDEEMVESMDAAFTAAVRTMKFTANDEKRKRKEGRKTEGKTKVKFHKVHLHESSVKDNFIP